MENKVNVYVAQINWFDKFTRNIQKTVCMSFGNYKDNIPKKFCVKIKGNEIKIEENPNNLGLIFDFKL